MTVKIAVFAPMPSASVSTATAVKPGFFSNWRKANLRSFITQRLHRIDFCRASRRKVTGEERSRSQQKPDASKGYRIGWLNFVKHRGQNPRQPSGPGPRVSRSQYRQVQVSYLGAQ